MSDELYASSAARYSYAVLTVAALLIIRLTVGHEITASLNPFPFLLFEIPVLFSAWFFGRGPGIAATIVSAVTVQYFLMPPAWSLYPDRAVALIPLAVFIGEGVVISFFASAKRAAGRKLDQRIRERTQQLEAAHRQLAQSEALAALGTGISKIAHEMANRVQALSAQIQFLEWHKSGQRPHDSKFDAITAELRNETRLLAGFIGELRELSRPMAISPKPVKVTELAAALLRFHSGLGKQAVQVEQQLAPGLPPVMADPDKLQEALVNLWKNAIEAMPHGGKISIRCYEQDGKVCIEIQDTGVGIPQDMKVFDLFTTSKKDGWGLGLPIVRQIILAHEGTVHYASKPGQGTIFTIALPAHPEDAS